MPDLNTELEPIARNMDTAKSAVIGDSPLWHVCDSIQRLARVVQALVDQEQACKDGRGQAAQEPIDAALLAAAKRVQAAADANWE